MRIQGPSGQPPEMPAEQTYRTLEGDTLHSVASKFQITPDALASRNNLELNFKLLPGLELIIPSREPGISAEAAGLGGIGDIVEQGGLIDPFNPVAQAWADSIGWVDDAPPWVQDSDQPMQQPIITPKTPKIGGN